MRLTGREFLELNIADDIGVQDEAADVIDFNVLLVLYGVLDEAGVDEVDVVGEEIR